MFNIFKKLFNKKQKTNISDKNFSTAHVMSNRSRSTSDDTYMLTNNMVTNMVILDSISHSTPCTSSHSHDTYSSSDYSSSSSSDSGGSCGSSD